MKISGARMNRIHWRLSNLVNITMTVSEHWNVDVTATSAEAVYEPSGCYVTLDGGGKDSPETVLDQKHMSATPDRYRLARDASAPGALAVLLVKEHRRNLRDKARRLGAVAENKKGDKT